MYCLKNNVSLTIESPCYILLEVCIKAELETQVSKYIMYLNGKFVFQIELMLC